MNHTSTIKTIVSLILIIFFQNHFCLAEDKIKNLIFLGDSLTEGYGVEQNQAYPHLIQQKIDSENKKWKVINSGISGSTSASAEARSKWILKSNNKPDLIVLLLGANDGLRGLKVAEMKMNLTSSIKLIKKNNVKIIIGEIMVPPNYGKQYSDSFKKTFSEIAKEQKIPMMPFILKDVAGKPDLNQNDGIHPNEKGHKIIADQVYQFLKEYL